MLELKLDGEVQGALLGEPIIPWERDAPPERRRKAIRQCIDLPYRLGYDAIRLRAPVPFQRYLEGAADTAELSRGERQWQNERTGPIQSLDDLERYPWPQPGDLDFTQAEEISRELPGGMGGIGYNSGVFEWSSWLMGLERFLYALYDDRELLRRLTSRVGQVILQAFEVFCRMDSVVALWLGDDLGFKTAPLMSPADLRELILPWYRRYAELAHAHGLPFLLHCCGNVKVILPDLVETVGIDAKHSFEDIIQPVEDFHRQWGDRIAAIGGVDIDILSRRDEEAVRQRTLQILERCAPRGGYIAGSGNSITNYVPAGNYLAMVEAIHRFNGRL